MQDTHPTIKPKPLPPKDTTELMTRVNQLGGKTFGQVAAEYGLSVPNNPLYAKGWMGQLLEYALGATGQSRSVPDFEHLGIELKTLPITLEGNPKESTYICTANIPTLDKNWAESRVFRKLKQVLWVLIESDKLIPIANRRIGQALLWSPTAEQEYRLKQDWEELTEKLNLGQFDGLSANHGTYLQIRPKASSSQVLIDVINHEGQSVKTVPKGFYLRSQFTKSLIRDFFKIEIPV